jgi:hypothetical protein
MDARQYMARRCVCGRPRAEHVHLYQVYDGQRFLRVLPVTGDAPCAGYLDEFELELQGNPLENPRLSPLVEEELAEIRIRQNGPVS